MANRNRPIQVKFRVTAEERKLIDKRMEQLGTMNMAAYLRKMAIDGYVVKLELPELRDLISLLRRTSNNFNQIARRVFPCTSQRGKPSLNPFQTERTMD